MARWVYHGIVRDGNSRIVPSATVTVCLAGTNTPARIYDRISGGSAIDGSAVTAGADGHFSFFIDDADYPVSQRFKMVVAAPPILPKYSKTYDYLAMLPPQNAFEDVRSYSSFSAAVAAIGENQKTLMIPESRDITDNETVPINVTLIFLQGGQINISSGKVLTINGHVEAGFYRIFSGSGSVKFGSNSAKQIVPQWFGAAGDNAADDTVSIQKASAACSSGHTLYFPPAAGYKVFSGVIVAPNINVIMDGTIYYDNASDLSVLTIGNSKSDSNNCRYRLSVKASHYSDWSNENNIGIRIVNANQCDITIVNAAGFTIGVQCAGDGRGFAYNYLHMMTIGNNRYQLDLHAMNKGWVNENLWIGGRFYCYSSLKTGMSRYGIRLTATSSPHYLNNNVFIKPNFELSGMTANPGEAVCVLVDYGIYNTIWRARTEGNSPTFMRVSNSSEMNVVYGGYGDVSFSSIDEQGSNPSTVVYGPRRYIQAEGKTIFQTGPLHEKSCLYGLADSRQEIHTPSVCGWAGPHDMTASVCHLGKLYRDHIGLDGQLLGVKVNTEIEKRFVLHIDGPTGSYRPHIRCKDTKGNIFAGASPFYCKSTANFGVYYNPDWKSYCPGSDLRGWQLFYFCLHNDVQNIDILIYGRPGFHIRGFSISSVDGYHATVSTGFETTSANGNFLAVESPRQGKQDASYRVGVRTYNAAPSLGSPQGWVCVSQVDTILTGGHSFDRTTLDVASTEGMSVGDLIGVQIDGQDSYFWTEIDSIPNKKQLTVMKSLPGETSKGNIVATNRWLPMPDL
jgi:hypothetical protein